MPHLYYCRCCFSTNLQRDAYVGINDEEVSTFDQVMCGDCGYDGRRYMEVHLPDAEFDQCVEFGEIPEEHREYVVANSQDAYL